MANDPDLVPGSRARRKAMGSVREVLAEAVAGRDKWDVFHGLAKFHCISGVVQNAKELTQNEHLRARNFMRETQIGDSTYVAPGPFGRLSETPWQLHRNAPKLGEHTKSHTNSIQGTKARDQRPETQRKGRLPLEGVKVLTFTQAWSGTHATQLLSLLGAHVVQIESLKRPDVWRGEGTPVPPGVRNPDIDQHPLNTNGLYNSVNLNKRAITLDMSQPEGREIFWDLVPKFDVLCENFSPHVMSNWGVTFETLKMKRPDIIFGSLSGYGQSGPIAEYPANGDTTEPMAGLSAMHGYEDGPAQNTGGLIPDPISGYYFASALLVALNHRQRTGQGQWIDLSMFESVAVQCGDAVLEYATNGTVRGPSGNRHPTMAPHGIYPTSDDQWVAIAAETDQAFKNLAEIVGLDDDRFDSASKRKQHEGVLDQQLGDWVKQRSRDEVCQTLESNGIALSPVEGPDEVYSEPNEQFKARGFLRAITHPESGTHFMPLLPWLYRNSNRGEVRHSPCLGQDSEEVLAEELEYTPSDYKRLVESGISGTAYSLVRDD